MKYKLLSILTLGAFALVASPLSFAQSEASEVLPTDSLNSEIADISEQAGIMVPSLFEDVVAPDDLPDLRSRTDYLMENFWNPFDFKAHKSVDQNALNHAFSVYVQAMQYASEKKVLDSVKKLIGNIKNNPGLSLQFAKAAEDNLYGPRAEIWWDQIYIPFLENVVANKKLADSKKTKYKNQLDLLRKTAIGAKFPQINFVSLDDSPSTMIVNKPYTIVELKTLNCEDCRYSDLKLDISSTVSDMTYDGNLDVYSIIIPERGESINVDKKNLNSKWHNGYSQNAAQLLDIRMYPSYYLVDNTGKILAKNEVVDNIIRILESLANNNKTK